MSTYTGPFSGPPLVAGSVMGIRHFVPSTEAFLYGPATGVPFLPGENIAVHAGPSAGLLVVGGVAVGVPSLLIQIDILNHRVAEATCRCGFYAYYDIGSSQFGGVWRVPAVIEGYGLVTLGTQGFRAEKARLVAVVEPPEARSTGGRALFEARGYDVPIYDTVEEMVEAHPLTESEVEPSFRPSTRPAFPSTLTTPRPRPVLPPTPAPTPPLTRRRRRWPWGRKR